MTLHVGDCLEVLRGLPEASVDAVITDPPYGIHFMGQAWDKPRLDKVRENTQKRVADGSMPGFRRFSHGGWHSRHTTLTEDRQFQAWCEEWAGECLRVLKPGAYLAAMGATRMYHRLACGVQDAGFEVRDSLAWLYGCGFPKSKNDGPRGTALKPAWEPVAVSRKPLHGTHRDNYEAHGTGYMNIDDARVPLIGDTVPEFEADLQWREKVQAGMRGERTVGTRRAGKRGGKMLTVHSRSGRTGGVFPGMHKAQETHQAHGQDIGRWPANVVHDGSEEVVAGFPRSASSPYPDGRINEHGFHGGHGCGPGGYIDSGSAVRYFYCAKPTVGEKEAGLAEHPADLKAAIKRKVEGGLTLTDATCGYTCGGTPPRRNVHPTCKPIALMRWLIRLLAPPGGTVLDPFLGSGTTAVAALLEGRPWIGIEREEGYAEIARQRIAWWTRYGETGWDRLPKPPRPTPKDAPEQGSLL